MSDDQRVEAVARAIAPVAWHHHDHGAQTKETARLQSLDQTRAAIAALDDARDAEIARWHQWAARLYERCEEAAPDEYEDIRNELMETCRPYANGGSHD
jgi:hypothetical protein